MLQALADAMRAFVVWLSGATNSAGIGIILTTVLIRVVLYPLTLKQSRAMASMRELQPKLQELQKKYKDKPQEYNRRVMELYKEHKVNPLGGCLPLLVQLPFLWALFLVLREFPAELDPRFLVWDLSGPASEPLLLLPILAALTTYGQMLLSTADTSQRVLMMIMPVFIGWISLSFPAGLVLYWVVSNIFSIGQQYFINKQIGIGTTPQGGKPGK